MSHRPVNLRFNFGYLLEADRGTSRVIELDYPRISLSDDVTLSPLQGFIQATRTTRGIYVEGKLQTAVEIECARCLVQALLPLEMELGEMFFYPPPAPQGELAVGEDGFVDLAPLVREISLLEIPMQPFCREACQGLCAICGQDLNAGPCDCEPDEIDPRLAVLRDLLDNDSEP